MKSKPIYVEIDIDTSMQALWEHTQRPELHEQWDLRFSEIKYLPRNPNDEQQRFLYRTNIGFGISIKGTGTTKSSKPCEKQGRVSSLFFCSDQKISLIREGSGFWKYEPSVNKIAFKTKFDYQTRFGFLGRWCDRLLFRPFFGYSTAWSFDLLRLWLEKGMQPASVIQKAAIHYLSVFLLAFLWIYQGVVPKLIYPLGGELQLLQQLGWFSGWEKPVLQLLGAAEVGVGFITMIWHKKKQVYKGQIVLLLLLAVAALIGQPELLQAPFNPLTLSGSMIGFCILAYLSSRDLPQAGNCLRSPESRAVRNKRAGGKIDGIHL